MAKKRISLAEIEKEDIELTKVEKPKHELPLKIELKNETYIPKSEPRIQKQELKKAVEALNDYEKMSVTVPVEVFEKLQDIGRQRRRNKQPYKMTDMVREALSIWLPKQKMN